MTKAKQDDNSTDVGKLFDAALSARADFAEDRAPLGVFLIAFRRFFVCAAVANNARFNAALDDFRRFNEKISRLDDDSIDSDDWRLFESGVARVELYDRRERARNTAPEYSIAELIAQGVTRAQIAKIYGFVDDNGAPDVAKVDARADWTPKKAQNSTDVDENGAFLATIAARALDSIGETSAPPEKIAELRALASASDVDAEKTARPETSAEKQARLDSEILNGVPIRQLSARFGVDVETIRARASVLGVDPVEYADQLPPRIVKAIQERAADVKSGVLTFAELARLVSTQERRVTSKDVRGVLGSL